MPLRELLAAVQAGKVEVGMAALTINAEREKLIDFSHPYYTAGLAIATKARDYRSWVGALRPFLSPAFLKTVAALALVLLTVGWLVWMFERKKNSAQFGGSPVQGIGSSFWWSAVTMTTVGYGDKAPVSLGGRIIAIIWMFTGIIIISSFTAAITTSLTVNRLEPKISGPQDLVHIQCGTLDGSTGQSHLEQNGIKAALWNTLAEGLQGLENEKVDAFIYDEPLLRHTVKKEGIKNLVILPIPGEQQRYGFALPPNSPLREQINRALLEVTAGAGWQEKLALFLGERE